MPQIQLRYGRTYIPFDYDEARFAVLGSDKPVTVLRDVELGEKLDRPIGSQTLEEIVRPGDTVLFVVPDATRETACGQIINLVVRRLIANGTSPSEMSIIFATGIHRYVTEREKQKILTPFIAQRIKTINHDPNDQRRVYRLGETRGGIPVELSWALTEFDHVILIGGVSFHYFAGFTGGRKLVCPGLASFRTITETHKLAFDPGALDRRAGVGPGRLDRNPVNEAFIEAASMTKVSFAINTIVNDDGEPIEVICGDWIRSHRAACEQFLADHKIKIAEKRPLVIASCGGSPHDLNMIQAHKTLEAASAACAEGGTIILIAECSNGLGRSDFLDWFESENSDDLARRLIDGYQVNGQTAWSLLRKTEKFDVRLISAIDTAAAEKMRLTPMQSLARAVAKISRETTGYILPFGSRYLLES
ncbi:MAG TPA: nickel-dependent lactate racemase [Pyrinomonadaceae bacterium]|nr:nickel-dependent lactate racemase [Pyrinomonadaceae bacterium]